MTAPGPNLSARDLEEELRQFHSRKHRTLSAAFYGAPAPGVDSVTVPLERGDVRFRVAHATCELLVRKALSEEGPDPVVVLVDYDGRLPLDVTSRLASGRVRSVTEERRLARLFGALAVSPEVLASPLKGALLADGGGGYGSLPGTTLDLDTAWRKYLERMTGYSAEVALSEERVIAHCAQAGDRAGFRRILGLRPDLQQALHRYLEERAGPVARLAWRAWEAETGPAVAAYAFILQAAKDTLGSSAHLQAWLSLRLPDLDPELANAVYARRPLLERWGALADRLSLQFGEDEAALDAIIDAAERLLSDDQTKEALGPSRYLPSALHRGKDRLAAALTTAAEAPGAAALGLVRDRLAAIDRHRLGEREPHSKQLDRARMAARLCGYLMGTKATAAHLPGDVVAELAAEYAREGGFLDWARAAARGPQGDRLDLAVAGVVARADAIRDDLDERFARALGQWSGRRKSDRVVPIDQALDRFAVEFLSGGEHRRLLVLLLDGMAWAKAVELLMDLEDNQRWSPVRWQPKGTTAELLPPMLAGLPTITEVSRGAFFAGRLLEPGEKGDTGRDPDRFDGHPGLRKLLGHGPQLLLRTETEDRPGHVSRKALDLVASDARIVAFVVNAIDDQLKVGPGMDVPCRVQNIKVLPDLLGAAAHARRPVLLVADHGHVRGDRFGAGRPPVKTLASARARELAAGDEPWEHELVLEGDAAWRPLVRNRLAMLYRESDCYGHSHHSGTHGGASLAEVVTPAVLIASDDLVRSLGVEDAELDPRSFPRPAWWDLEAVPAVAAPPAPAPVRKERPPEKPTRQLTMPLVAPPAPPLVALAGPSRWATLLRASDLYKKASKSVRDQWDGLVIPAVDLLAEHEGVMSDAIFANRLSVPKYRVSGMVANAADHLNLQQHLVIEYDRPQGLVRLNRVLLEQLFSG